MFPTSQPLLSFRLPEFEKGKSAFLAQNKPNITETENDTLNNNSCTMKFHIIPQVN